MNVNTLLIDGKYIFLMLILCVGSFLLVSYLLSIPGNRKIKSLNIDNAEEQYKRKTKKLIIKFFIIVFFGLFVIIYLNT